MSESPPKTIPIQNEDIVGIQALIELGEENLAKLARIQCQQPLELNLSNVYDRLVADLECDRRTLQLGILNALISFNGLRRRLELPAAEFLTALDHTLTNQSPQKWRENHLDSWKAIVPHLSPFFEPDNFFAQVSKAFDLLSERPTLFQSARILTEFRPIFNEEQSRTLAVLQTNTLVLEYWDGQNRTLHVSLDSSDLEDLQIEMNRARQKIGVVKREAIEKGSNLVTYGELTEQ